jgi:acyl-coenzyme A thioesterase PaaI-like protein
VTRDGRARLADELRRVARLSVAGELDDATAARIADGLAREAQDAQVDPGTTPWWWQVGTDEAIGGWERYNPVAPPVELSFDGQAVRGTVTMGVEFTGPPRTVHGGFVATLLDHALGIYLSRIQRPSYTAILEVRYLAPTPVGCRLDLEATHSVIDGPLTLAWAELRHEGRTTARAEGRFRLPHDARRLPQRSTA